MTSSAANSDRSAGRRVMLVTGDLNTSGAEMLTFHLACELQRRGVYVHVVALRARGDLAEQYRRENLPLTAGVLKWRWDLLAAVRIARILRREAIDSLIAVDVFPNVMLLGLGAVSLCRRPIRRYLWAHTTPTGWAGDFTGRIRKCFDLGWLDKVICISRLQQEQFEQRGIAPERIRRIYNGIELERYQSAAPADWPVDTAGQTIFLQIANHWPHKDFDTLIRAGGLLAERNIPCRIFLAGRGTDSAEIRQAIQDAHAEDVVAPLGFRRDIPELLAGCDGLVLSSHDEVFNVAVLEAMAAGKPVLTTDVQGFEMFTHDMEGLKTPPGNPAALAEAIESLADDVALRERLAAAGQETVQQFSLRAMTDEFEKILREDD